MTYFDGVVNNAAGEAVVIKNAVCLHEEDHGLLWKHVDYRCVWWRGRVWLVVRGARVDDTAFND